MDRGKRPRWLRLRHCNEWRLIARAGKESDSPMWEMKEIAKLWAEWAQADEPSLLGYDIKEFVYVLAAPEVCRIKIGYTTEPDKRFRAITSVGPCPVKVLALMPGTMSDERFMHSFFQTERLPGTEWFHATLRVLRFVELARSATSAHELIRASATVEGIAMREYSKLPEFSGVFG